LKKPSKNTQQRNPPVFFLDRNLGAEKLAAILRAAEFTLITHTQVYKTRQNVKDPEIIADCGKARTVLLTADTDLEFSYAAEINEAKIAIFVLSNNNDGPEKWGPRIINARQDMDRELGRRRKSFSAQINTEGRVCRVRIYYRKKTKEIHISLRGALSKMPAAETSPSVVTDPPSPATSS
jgi:predicted nuclease of predicted toxin-antitoxin system